MNCIKIESGRIELVLETKKIGEDYILTLTGGKKHAGAVAVGFFDEKTKLASSSVLTLPGHREDQIALKGARIISKTTRKTTVFVVGIHFEDISSEEIEEIVQGSEKIIKMFLENYEQNY
ncbi:MAG: hypothetical protein PHD41_02900 [Methanosarcinaceae archaeon]|nr:hypothetical protein [Methanosarcinaceae archaeon]MDD4331156.1 hypothetical protein [Methanosarcinaceae archaeon]MDD4749939.1 hypothetical protein [Methanosarcinaceae archaeon]